MNIAEKPESPGYQSAGSTGYVETSAVGDSEHQLGNMLTV